jgi:hypothetical protein
VSIGELRRGFAILPKGKRRTKLEFAGLGVAILNPWDAA